MLAIKQLVQVDGIRPELILAVIAAAGIWRDLGQTLVITSCKDGKHATQSLHWAGQAIDFRTSYFADAKERETARNRLAAALGGDYDVILEGDHIHCEYQPRRHFP